jgi:hypothetical protein
MSHALRIHATRRPRACCPPTASVEIQWLTTLSCLIFLRAVHLHLTERDGDAVTKRQLLVVDLAGSERILRSGAEGVAAAQAMAINTSLTALGKVVRAIGAGASHVPYRDSTLTQLLRSSLAGRACTSVVITVASDTCHTDESKCSLEFGQRMQAVRTKASVVARVAAEDDIEQASRALEAAKLKLAEFFADGYGERFGANVQPGEKRAFLENTSRLAEYEAEIRASTVELAELKADSSRTEAERRDEMRALASSLRETSAEIVNLRQILKRQKAISGFYIPARAVCTRKEAEVRALESKIETLREAANVGTRPDMRLPMVESTVATATAGPVSPPALS